MPGALPGLGPASVCASCAGQARRRGPLRRPSISASWHPGIRERNPTSPGTSPEASQTQPGSGFVLAEPAGTQCWLWGLCGRASRAEVPWDGCPGTGSCWQGLTRLGRRSYSQKMGFQIPFCHPEPSPEASAAISVSFLSPRGFPAAVSEPSRTPRMFLPAGLKSGASLLLCPACAHAFGWQTWT